VIEPRSEQFRDVKRDLDYVRRRLSRAIQIAGVDFSEDDRELLRHSVGQVRAELDALAQAVK
jgi:hypothetical protein